MKPEFAEAILAGKKTVELRRIRPKIESGDLILLYSTSPVCEVVGVCTVEDVFVDKPKGLWQSVKDDAGVPRATFESYFEGAEQAVAIRVRDPARRPPVSLGEMRKVAPGFMPPQSYRYLRSLSLSLRSLLAPLADGRARASA